MKTDAVDARTLAHLLRADLLPEAYIAPRELRDLRDPAWHLIAERQASTSSTSSRASTTAPRASSCP